MQPNTQIARLAPVNASMPRRQRAKYPVRSVPAAIKLAKLRAKYPNVPKSILARAAGYSPTNHSFDSTKINLEIIESIEKERDKAVRATGLTITKQLTKLNEIIDNPDEHAMPKIHAIRTVNTMLPGYNAPTNVQISQRSLFVEYQAMGHDDLVNLAEALK